MLRAPWKILVITSVLASLSLGNVASVRADRSEVPNDAVAAKVRSAQLFSAGYFSTCLASSDGTAKCWGYNGFGQLGIGTNANAATPTAVVGLTTVKEISAGANHTCAVLADTSVKCWGYNVYGQLGTGNTTDSNEPKTVKRSDGLAPLTGVASIAAGYFSTCASMLADGSVYCWGAQVDGKLGNGQTSWVAVSLPVAVEVSPGAQLTQVTQLSVGQEVSCGLSQADSLFCWGSGTNGIIGDGTNSRATRAKAVPGLSGIKSFSAGSAHVCAVATGGAYCWGGSSNYPFGLGSAVNTPTLVRASGVEQIVAGNNATCILQTDKKVQCVGSFFGENNGPKKKATGGDTLGEVTDFADVPGVSNASLIAIGGDHACAQSSGGLLCWGRNDFGQLGSGSASLDNKVATLAVASQPQTITFAEVPTKNVGSEPFDIEASADTGRPVRFAIAASAAAVCSISGTKVTILDSGDCVINATVDAEGMYAESTASKTVTVAALAPVATTGDTSALTMNSATLAGTTNPRGASTSLTFEYGTDAALKSPTSAAVKEAQTGNSVKSVSVDLAGLGIATTYYYRLVAKNTVGTTNGDIKSFTTKGSKPTAVTGSATRGASGMTVNGKINPKDLETSVRFEYGTDSKLVGAQQTAPKSQTGSEDVDVTAVISGLAENTTYYYRILATNVVGTAEGDIKSFTTTRPEGVTINDGDEFTASESVIVSVVGPSTAVKAILSNDGGFKTSETFDLTNNSADINWKLQSSREGTFTKIVYVKYVSRFGSQSQPVTDDIILDTTKPVMSAATAAAAAPTGSAVAVARIGASAKKATGGVRLSLRGSDTISGIGVVEVRSASNKPATRVKIANPGGKADGKPRATSQTVSLKTTAKRLQVRVIDRAGNASAWRTIPVK